MEISLILALLEDYCSVSPLASSTIKQPDWETPSGDETALRCIMSQNPSACIINSYGWISPTVPSRCLLWQCLHSSMSAGVSRHSSRASMMRSRFPSAHSLVRRQLPRTMKIHRNFHVSCIKPNKTSSLFPPHRVYLSPAPSDSWPGLLGSSQWYPSRPLLGNLP